MARVDIPVKVQLGCDDCHRFLLKQTAEHKAEVARLQEQLETARQVADDGWAWVEKALAALGVETVFDIPAASPRDLAKENPDG